MLIETWNWKIFWLEMMDLSNWLILDFLQKILIDSLSIKDHQVIWAQKLLQINPQAPCFSIMESSLMFFHLESYYIVCYSVNFHSNQLPNLINIIKISLREIMKNFGKILQKYGKNLMKKNNKISKKLFNPWFILMLIKESQLMKS